MILTLYFCFDKKNIGNTSIIINKGNKLSGPRDIRGSPNITINKRKQNRTFCMIGWKRCTFVFGKCHNTNFQHLNF